MVNREKLMVIESGRLLEFADSITNERSSLRIDADRLPRDRYRATTVRRASIASTSCRTIPPRER